MANGFQTFHDYSPEQIQAITGFTQTEDGRWMAPDGESFLDTDQITQGLPLNYDADPLIDGAQYRNIEGWANNDVDPQRALQIELAHLRSFGINPVQHPEYGWIVPDDGRLAQAHPTQDSSSIFDFGPLLIAAFMVPAIASSLAAAGTGAAATALGSGVGATDVLAGTALANGGTAAGTIAAGSAGTAGTVTGMAAGDALAGTALAGTAAGGVAGTATGALANAVGGGLIGSGAEVVAPAVGAGGTVAAPEATLPAGQEAARSIAQEWGNYVDPWASGNAETVANSGVAGDMGITVESAATKAGDITDIAKAPTPPSNTQDAARRLVASAEDVTSAEAGSGAWPASSGVEGGTLLDRIWKGVTSPQGIGASINVIGGTIGGMGIAGINRDTMEKKSELDLQNAQAMQQFRTDQSRANMFKGIIGVRPAATRAPLQRLTGGPVYNERGLIRRA